MACQRVTSFKRVILFIAATANGCGAVFLQAVTYSNASKQLPTKPAKKTPRTFSHYLKHLEDRMSGKILWRSNKHHAAGSNCLCSFALDKKQCSKNNDDDSHCFLVCCIAGKRTDCECAWAITSPGACAPSQNTGQPCFKECCDDVVQDVSTYGALAYPGAELLYPPKDVNRELQPKGMQEQLQVTYGQQSNGQSPARPASQYAQPPRMPPQQYSRYPQQPYGRPPPYAGQPQQSYAQPPQNSGQSQQPQIPQYSRQPQQSYAQPPQYSGQPQQSYAEASANPWTSTVYGYSLHTSNGTKGHNVSLDDAIENVSADSAAGNVSADKAIEDVNTDNVTGDAVNDTQLEVQHGHENSRMHNYTHKHKKRRRS